MGDLHHDALTRELTPGSREAVFSVRTGTEETAFRRPGPPESAENAAPPFGPAPQKRRFRNIVNEKNINLYKDILLTHP